MMGSSPALLGRSQVVRHRFLVPAFAGSIPAAPAKSGKSLDFSILLVAKRVGSVAVRNTSPGHEFGVRAALLGLGIGCSEDVRALL
jgi:hypothetical protein